MWCWRYFLKRDSSVVPPSEWHVCKLSLPKALIIKIAALQVQQSVPALFKSPQLFEFKRWTTFYIKAYIYPLRQCLLSSFYTHYEVVFRDVRACPWHKRPVKHRRVPEILIFRLDKTRSLVILSRGFCNWERSKVLVKSGSENWKPIRDGYISKKDKSKLLEETFCTIVDQLAAVKFRGLFVPHGFNESLSFKSNTKRRIWTTYLAEPHIIFFVTCNMSQL